MFKSQVISILELIPRRSIQKWDVNFELLVTQEGGYRYAYKCEGCCQKN